MSTGKEELVAADDQVIGRAIRYSLVVILAMVVLGGGIFVLSRAREEEPPPQVVDVAPPGIQSRRAEPPEMPFVDVTAAAGIDFVHTSGAAGDKLMPETMGGGVAVLDIDGDGDQDLIFVNGCRWADLEGGMAADRPTMKLYLGDGAGSFTDATVAAGLDLTFYGMSVAPADADGDGDLDLLFTALGSNRLLENRDGRFVDVTERAGVGGDPGTWHSCAAWFDADADGDLDLYVGAYVKWSREIDLEVGFQLTGVGRAYGPPFNFEGAQGVFYRNRGDGSFSDDTEGAGFIVNSRDTGAAVGKALGVLPLDHDRDGRLDLFVANDTTRNFLFRSLGDGSFEEIGEIAGVAYDRDGRATGAMGVDAAFFRNDDTLGLAIGNFANEMTSFYVSQRDPTQLVDEAIGAGIGAATRRRLGFGIVFLDVDLDGRLDLLAANGHIEDEIGVVQSSMSYRQPAQLFWNAGAGGATFIEVAPGSTGDLARPIVGRGLTYGDLDGDGDLDVVVTQTGGAPMVLRNDASPGHHWLRVRLRGRAPNPQAIGATVELTAAGQRQSRQVMPTRSYLSAVELPVTFGLGAATRVDALVVTWPDGERQEVAVEGVDRMLEISR